MNGSAAADGQIRFGPSAVHGAGQCEGPGSTETKAGATWGWGGAADGSRSRRQWEEKR